MSIRRFGAVGGTLAVLAVGCANVVGAHPDRVGAPVVAAQPETAPGVNGRIAFTRFLDQGRTAAIFTAAADGSGARQVTRPQLGAQDGQPDWARDGTRIVFEREYTGGPVETFRVRADGSGLRRLDPGCPAGLDGAEICEASSPAWSPDGRRVAFGWAYGGLKRIRGEEWIEVGAIAVMNADGKRARQLTQLRRPTSSEDFEPAWSPDGKRIAFVRQNSTAKPVGSRAIFVISASGGKPRRVTPWRLDAGDHPDWSPDGKWILFLSSVSDDTRKELYVVRPDGSGLRAVTDYPANVVAFSASFSPDGRWIVFARTPPVSPGSGAQRPDLYLIRPNGKGEQRITRTDVWESGPDWGPRG